MSAPGVEQRLEAYGETLRGVLAQQQPWQPPSGGGGGTIPVLGTRLGQWFGQYVHIVIAVLAASAITAVAFVLSGGNDLPVASGPASEVLTGSDLEATEGSGEGDRPELLAPVVVPTVASGEEDHVLSESVAAEESAPTATEAPASATTVSVELTPEPSNRATAAPAGELGCARGVLQGTRCRVIGSEPSPVPAECTDLVGDDGSCYRIESAQTDCGLGRFSESGGCVSQLANLSRERTCESGHSLVNDSCIRYAVPVLGCASGSLVGAECETEGNAPSGGEMVCPNPAASADDCHEVVAADCAGLISLPDGGCRQDGSVNTETSCPSGMSLDGSSCVASPSSACPAGTAAEPEGCVSEVPVVRGHSCPDPDYVIIRGGDDDDDDDEAICRKVVPPELTCSVGSLVGDACVEPPTAELRCSLTDAIVASADDCYEVVAASCGGLAAGAPGTCIQPLTPVQESYVCADGFQLDGSRCVSHSSPHSVCTEGTLVAGDQCEIPGADPVLVRGECPTGETDSAGCVVTYEPQRSCAQGELALDGTCRVDIEVGTEALICEPSFGLEEVADEPSICVRYEAAIRR